MIVNVTVFIDNEDTDHTYSGEGISAVDVRLSAIYGTKPEFVYSAGYRLTLYVPQGQFQIDSVVTHLSGETIVFLNKLKTAEQD